MQKVVDILGTEYKIIFKEFDGKQDVDGYSIDGYCDYTSKEIVIRNDNINELGDFIDYQKHLLRHEIIHAFMSESGLRSNWQHAAQFGQDETTVDWFAIQSPKIYKVYKTLDIL